MPKELSPDLSERILEKAAASQFGVGKSELMAMLGKTASARTVARRLAELVSAQRLLTVGRARALRYRVPPVTGTGNLVSSPAQVSGGDEVYVPISNDARQGRDYVRKPLTLRRPGGYRSEFLERY